MGIRRSNHGRGEAGVVGLIDELLSRAIQAGASDVHFEPTDNTLCVRVRVDGVLQDLQTIPAALHPNVVTRLKVMAGLLSYRVDIPQEGGLTLEGEDGIDARISTLPTVRGERVVVRLLPNRTELRDLATLGLSEHLIEDLSTVAAGWQGLILVCGPAGSGKTTTLYALLRHLQHARTGVSLMTVEDPVELRLDGVSQTQVSPHGELTYARALRSLLRQDPQVVLIGEVRDAETARIATEAALTGHLILSTMHSGSVADAVVRLMEMGIAPYELTSTLKMILSQRLLRTLCKTCQGSGRTKPAAAEKGGHAPHDLCGDCLGSGYRGRTACAEYALMSADLRAAILERADSDRIRRAVSSREPHVNLAADAERHRDANRTTQEEITRLALREGRSLDAD